MAASASPDVQASDSWTGYSVGGHTFTKVQGHWTVPEVTGPDQLTTAYQWIWVGIGYNPIIQAGTKSEGNGGSGRLNAFWWEVWPNNGPQEVYRSTVLQGDLVYVIVTATATHATFHFVDESLGYDATFAYDGNLGARQHAEWIDERPTVDHARALFGKPRANPVISSASEQSIDNSFWKYVGEVVPANQNEFDMFTICRTKMLGYPGAIYGPNLGQFQVYWLDYGGGPGDFGC